VVVATGGGSADLKEGGREERRERGRRKSI